MRDHSHACTLPRADASIVSNLSRNRPTTFDVDELLAEHPRPRFGLTREFFRLWLLARYGWSRGARPWLGAALALAAILVAVFLHFHIFRPDLWRAGDVHASLPLTSELIRLPMSALLPTAYLPLWASCLQLLVVIGLGELILGRWLTIGVALVGHYGSTLMARFMLDDLHSHLFGLTPALAHVLDTGPSGATTAVGACLVIATRMHRTAALLAAGLLIAAVLAPGLDGVEHTTALLCGLVAGVIYLAATSSSPASTPTSATKTRARGVLRAFRSPRSALSGMHDED